VYEPASIAVDAQGKIYVVNYTSSGSSYGSVTTYSSAGAKTTPTITKLSEPQAIAVTDARKILVSNGGSEILSFAADGKPTSPTITA
jgi:DNA-binding beta-propeller fold protein YncE